MKKETKEKKKFIAAIALLLILFIGIGYAILTETINITGTTNYDAMKWNIGFITAVDNGGTSSTTSTISDDGKSITIGCDIGISSASETCIVKATIKNDSTFSVELNENPTISYESPYISAVTTSLSKGSYIAIGKTINMIITITTKELTPDTLPQTEEHVSITVNTNWTETSTQLIQFTVNETTYTAEKTMTWEDFVNSKYNPGEFTLTASNVYLDGTSLVTSSYSWIDTDAEIAEDSIFYTIDHCCFDPDMRVLMADGTYKKIIDVKVGDMVMSLNEDTGEYIPQRVQATIIKENSNDLVYVNLSNGVRLGMRAYHPLLTTEGWKSLRPELAETTAELENIELLEVGDTLVGYEENVTIVSIEQRPEVENYNTYNLSIEGYHNYIVEGIVAHNVDACFVPDPQPKPDPEIIE